MAIAFICNKDFTIPFEAAARFLRDAGEDVVWLSPSTRWSKWLISEGWPAASILNLPDRRQEWMTMSEAAAREAVAPFESEPTATAVNIIRMCRGLKGKPVARALGYVAVAADAVSNFCREKGVTVMLGETTWGFELACWLAARKLGVPHFCPARTRLPADRTCLIEPLLGDLIAPFDTMPEHFEAARTFYREWSSRPRPAFGATLGGAGFAGVEWAWVRELRQIAGNRHDEAGDETIWPLRRRIADRAYRIAANRRMARYFRSRPAPPDAPYLLYCMHHQPEAAIDVAGVFNSDQRDLIERLIRLLPASHRLHIRAHKAGLADFPLSWWREVAQLPGVVIVNPFEDIWPQMKGSAATVSVAGTVLFEAALLGVPALGLANVHFAELFAAPVSRRTTPLDWPLSDILDPAQRERWAPDEETRIAYLAKLIANSGKGILDDLRVAPEIRADANWKREEAEFLLTILTRLGLAGRASSGA